MPPPARHRLDLLVVPKDPDAPADVMRRAVDDLGAAGLWPHGLGDGGPARLVDLGRQLFLSNRQGGFRVRCPGDGRIVHDPFVHALEAWRGGGTRILRCPCGDAHDLAELSYSPPAAFALAWIEVPEVQTPELTVFARALLPQARVLYRRG